MPSKLASAKGRASQSGSRHTHSTGGAGVTAAGDGHHFFREVARGYLVAHLAHGGGDLTRPTAQVKDARREQGTARRAAP